MKKYQIKVILIIVVSDIFCFYRDANSKKIQPQKVGLLLIILSKSGLVIYCLT